MDSHLRCRLARRTVSAETFGSRKAGTHEVVVVAHGGVCLVAGGAVAAVGSGETGEGQEAGEDGGELHDCFLLLVGCLVVGWLVGCVECVLGGCM